MRLVVQRVSSSSVSVNGEVIGQIKKGLNVLVGFTNGDSLKDIDYLVNKIINLRIFDDENGVMNKSVLDIGGSILLISQFTLYADSKKGNRPSYLNALKACDALLLYEQTVDKMSQFVNVQTGLFGADMQVLINNDGPITICIDSK